jgi:hypothetical protein
LGHCFEDGWRLKDLDVVVHRVMGYCFEDGWRLKDLDIVVYRVMGQWDTVLKTGGD